MLNNVTDDAVPSVVSAAGDFQERLAVLMYALRLR
jgi:hypothetical protein